VKRGDECDAVIEDLAVEGKSVARIDGFVVFVRGGVPGDVLRVRIRTVKRNFAEADLLALLKPSPHRTEPRCRYFGTCGGCTLQNVAYASQLEFKQRQVAEALARLGGFASPAVPVPLACADPYFYRNKMEFSFGERWRTTGEMAELSFRDDLSGGAVRDPALGLHLPGRYDRILDLFECWLQSESSARIVNFVRAFCLEEKLPVFSTLTQSGYLRNLVIRGSKRTGETMVNLVTYDDRPDVMTKFTARLLAEFPALTTVVNNITARRSQVAVGERETVYHGTGTITERIGKRTYRISANSFFQTNTEQAERLYDTALRFAQLRPEDTVYDLYSGTGTIALHVADGARSVVGIESVEQSVLDARRNAESNGVHNCVFLQGDLKDTLLSSRRGGDPLPAPDVVIADPPRAGMHEKVAREIVSLSPRTIVYVSCNPSTQARDLKIICESGKYSIHSIQPVDMFPHTQHIENVVGLINSFQ
jgi:23S rRNA (uracil1939-C5)-methyltransferase